MNKIGFISTLLAATLFGATHGEQSSALNNFDPKSVDHIVIKMNALSTDGDKSVGEVIAINTADGVAFFPRLSGLSAPGMHGFHVHVNPDCGSSDKGLGMKAGGHWDPQNTGKHSFYWDNDGHKGDLPALYVDANGDANYPVLSTKIKNINELKGHSLMVHLGADNHSDSPKPLGGGGARLVCGVIN
ncbi:superoxide dismutase family protein [Campylobacter fetus]|uniref:superoxide dismutase family protein n=1 Tax=Campylobacter fetus TaxID=196 RepID=UPI0003C27F9D|nr:superoxide dismutase family protein [Campylobacter fetus]AGZ82143.1 superoxide dismutase (Cu/Zn) [Campylobacter fetus subsp. testudinum 03-427]AJB45871.1 superoxide dismutase [Campylobacter fetus subsp. testudinum]EAI4322218.1 superoxide dismutase family protein [Campylobacter fetus]EAI4391852.1 superoxide dismutase family protein [Campylobacter fetus]OCS06469.1 superoxide dismutase [Campylobacter fetus subsp. testudinum]